jgi:hypothetical protein
MADQLAPPPGTIEACRNVKPTEVTPQHRYILAAVTEYGEIRVVVNQHIELPMSMQGFEHFVMLILQERLPSRKIDLLDAIDKASEGAPERLRLIKYADDRLGAGKSPVRCDLIGVPARTETVIAGPALEVADVGEPDIIVDGTRIWR